MPQFRKIIETMTFFAYCTYAFPTFGGAETIIKHRPVTSKIESDPLNKTTATMRSETDKGTLKINCLPDKGLSAEIKEMTVRLSPNTNIRSNYRTDEGSASEDKAWPISGNGAVLPNSRQILEDAVRKSVMHIHIAIPNGATTGMVFRPKDVSGLLRKIRTDCPTDAPPPDQNGLAK